MPKRLGTGTSVCTILIILGGLANIFGQVTKVAMRVNVSPNRLAPEFYSQDLSMKATLINLPGSNVAGSTWTLTYEVYFLPEGQAREVAVKRGGRLGSETTAADFPKRIFLGKGSFVRKKLITLSNRTINSEHFKFGPKIPSSLQTEGADLYTVYTIKIYDAELKKTIVKNGQYFGRVFRGNKQKREKIYLNFFIAPSGELFNSQIEKEDDSTEWKMF